MRIRISLIALSLLTLTGCGAEYVTPGRGADMSVFGGKDPRRLQTDYDVQQRLDLKPLASFPTAIAVARVQAPGYRSYSNHSWGTGRYSVVTTRDVESDQSVASLTKLPMVTGVAPLNRMVLPERLESDRDLRQAAASLHADMLLIYTIDTTFDTEDLMEPMTIVTLGLSPNQQARVTTTASAMLMDTRNGYVYALAEATEKDQQLANAWTSETAVDQTRRRTEAKAFDKLIADFTRAWPRVVEQYAVK
ncbi:MAG: hypothetical protein WD042_17875 [Phycisphaeraceae bacterium]